MTVTVENKDFRMGYDGCYSFDLRLADSDWKGIKDGKIHALTLRRKGELIGLFRNGNWEIMPKAGAYFNMDMNFINKLHRIFG